MSKIISLFKKFEYYKSIEELPIFNWFKIQETNDLKWLMKDPGDCTKGQVSTLETYMQKMTDEYVDTFGISDEHRRILMLKTDIACLEIDFLLNGDRKINTFLKIKRKELEKLITKSQSRETTNIQVHVSKYMGGSLINMRTTTVKEFYGILQEMKKEATKKAAK